MLSHVQEAGLEEDKTSVDEKTSTKIIPAFEVPKITDMKKILTQYVDLDTFFVNSPKLAAHLIVNWLGEGNLRAVKHGIQAIKKRDLDQINRNVAYKSEYKKFSPELSGFMYGRTRINWNTATFAIMEAAVEIQDYYRSNGFTELDENGREIIHGNEYPNTTRFKDYDRIYYLAYRIGFTLCMPDPFRITLVRLFREFEDNQSEELN